MQARLFRTGVFRLSLIYAGMFGLMATAAFAFLYWSTADYMESQTDARLRLEADVLLSQYRSRALPALLESVRERSRPDGGRRIFFYRLYGPDLGDSAPLASRLMVEPAEWQTFATVAAGEVLPIPRDDERAKDPVRVLVYRLSGEHFLVVGRDLNEQQELLDHTLQLVLAALGITLLIALAGGAMMGYGVLRRIDAVTRTAGEIMAGDLSRRVPLEGRGDEFDELARKLNGMLSRIEQLLQGMREVTDNVAHDLRGPLTRLRNRLEVTLLEAREEQEYRGVMEQAIGDADALIRTFNALLSIARAEAGVRGEDWCDVDLAGLVEELGELYAPLAEEKALHLSWECAQRVTVRGNRQLLAQAISNLLDNAIKYLSASGSIGVRLDREGQRAVLEVVDTGPGIPATARQRVLERFVRLESARNTPGNGLGLSLVQAVAHLHAAELSLEDNEPGLRVRLLFPAC